MRGILILLMATVILCAGCMTPYSGNESASAPGTISNETPVAPPRECTGPVCGVDGTTYSTDCDAVDAMIAIAYYGACMVEENCTDTDGGLVPEILGTATKGDESSEDYCLDSTQLIEYTCANNSITPTTLQCEAGEECSGGRCVELPPPNVSTGCSGPTEADIYSKQAVTYNGSTYSDICIDFDTVKDFYCKDNEIESINHECPPGYGCSDGHCYQLSYECTDTDSGNDPMVKGKVTVSKGMAIAFNSWDVCYDEGTITEYYCLMNGSWKGEDILCPTGKCSEGRCVRSDCTDSDGGRNATVAGTATVGSIERSDECEDDNTLIEYYCYGDDIRSDRIGCVSGYVCDDDRCVPD